MKYVDEIDADVIVTIRYADGELTAKAAAACEYQSGATCSASVDLPESVLNTVRAALDAAIPELEAELGKELSKSKALAIRVAQQHGELVS